MPDAAADRQAGATAAATPAAPLLSLQLQPWPVAAATGSLHTARLLSTAAAAAVPRSLLARVAADAAAQAAAAEAAGATAAAAAMRRGSLAAGPAADADRPATRSRRHDRAPGQRSSSAARFLTKWEAPQGGDQQSQAQQQQHQPQQPGEADQSREVSSEGTRQAWYAVLRQIRALAKQGESS